MSAASDSDDVSDIFWPGYVDAISNLAINLLFVIAIMAIVVISATLQLQELMKRKDKDPAQVSATTTSAPPAPEALQDIVAKQQKTIAQQAAQIRKLQEDARQAERRASASSAPSRPDSQEPPAPAERREVVEASTPASAPEGKNRTQVRKSGVIVNFASNVVQLSAAEIDDLNTKLKRFAPLSASQKWRIHVVTPKGFSEATRLAFYRANAVRSVLLKAGVPGEMIEVRVQESERDNADNTKVVVRPAT